MSGVWVFGYGSLVSAVSFGSTVGRSPVLGVDLHEAELRGYERRWNYGVMSRRGESDGPHGTTTQWTIVALGLVELPAADPDDEPDDDPGDDVAVNGVIAWVADEELPHLDRRERHYDRVDVTHLTNVLDRPARGTLERRTVDGRIVTYVPRDEPVRWYESARDRGEAAVDRRYWDLVDGAFARLGTDRRDLYRATTPEPDVPVVAMRSVPMRDAVGR